MMHARAGPSPQGPLPRLFLLGMPGSIGGAATKVAHLLRLLHRCFEITVVVPDVRTLKDSEVRKNVEALAIPCTLLNDVPRKTEGTALAICDKHFFAGGHARQLKERGLKVVWSNEMMWPFEGEEDAARQGLVDRVLFVSEFQATAFRSMYEGVPSLITGNYIDPDDYCWRERRNAIFTLGRLSRADVDKFPLDFPVFYEEMGLKEVRYRVMAWSPALQRQYRWHRFGPEWELLAEYKQSALKFLYSLDVFLYPLGHKVKESWGRAVVESMLTGCVPVVAAGHQFHKLIAHGETGFICREFGEFREAVFELFENYALRMKVGRTAAQRTREEICNPESHRRLWVEALSF